MCGERGECSNEESTDCKDTTRMNLRGGEELSVGINAIASDPHGRIVLRVTRTRTTKEGPEVVSIEIHTRHRLRMAQLITDKSIGGVMGLIPRQWKTSRNHWNGGEYANERNKKKSQKREEKKKDLHHPMLCQPSSIPRQ